MINIFVITIFKGDKSRDLLKTLKSSLRFKMKNKSKFKIKILLILNTKLNLKPKHRKSFDVYLNQDTGLYNAMNLGLNKLSKKKGYVIFMNSGDQFMKGFDITKNYQDFLENKCISFKVNLIYFEKYILINNKDDKFICHNSLFVPLPSIFFDENKDITSDALWMENNVSSKEIIYKEECSTLYMGMGLSDKPTLKTNFIYFKNYNFTKFILRTIYMLMYFSLPKFLLIRFLAIKRGYSVKKI